MALIPLSLRNIPLTPYKRKAYTDIFADYIPHCLLMSQTDPVTGRVNQVNSINLGERDLFPSYDRSKLRHGPNYGKQP